MLRCVWKGLILGVGVVYVVCEVKGLISLGRLLVVSVNDQVMPISLQQLQYIVNV